MLPFGIVTFTVTVALWSTAIGMVTAPLWAWSTPERADRVGLADDVADPWRSGRARVRGARRPPVLFVTPWVVRAMAAGNQADVIRGMLGTDLVQRVKTLTETRAAAVDLAAEDRRRIERDLHDGVQQRLVALAMDLGRAKDKMETDPDRARSS